MNLRYEKNIFCFYYKSEIVLSRCITFCSIQKSKIQKVSRTACKKNNQKQFILVIKAHFAKLISFFLLFQIAPKIFYIRISIIKIKLYTSIILITLSHYIQLLHITYLPSRWILRHSDYPKCEL